MGSHDGTRPNISHPHPFNGMAVDTAENEDLKEEARQVPTTYSGVEAVVTLKDQLLEAAEIGQNEVIEDILKTDGIDICATNRHGRTALHLASLNGHYKAVQELLNTGDRTETNNEFLVAKDQNGMTALHLASELGYKDVVRELLKNTEGTGNMKDFLIAKTRDDRTALHLASKSIALDFASMSDYKRTVQELLKTSDKIGNIKHFLITQDSSDNTALHVASDSGRAEVVKELLETSEKTGIIKKILNLRNKDGRTALHLASVRGNEQVVQELLNPSYGSEIINELMTARDDHEETALHLASYHGCKEVIQELLSRNVIDILNLKNKDGRTALHIASIRGQKEVVQELLNNSHGTDIIDKSLTIRDSEKRSALHLASEWGHKDVVQELLTTSDRAGIINEVLNFRDERGRTALHIACTQSSEEIIQMLLDKNADLEIQSASRNTPLMEAIWSSREHMVKFLLERGANPKTRSANYSALTAACYCPRTEKIVRHLLDKDLDINDKDPDGWAPIHTVCLTNSEASLAVINLLVGRHADLQAQNSSKQTPLHLALTAGNQEITRLILEKTENIEIQDEDGLTPLHVAAQEKNEEAIKLLIEKVVKLQATDKTGCTALHYAIRRELSEGDADNRNSIVTLLLNNYAPINTSNANGETPLHWAAMYGGLDIVQLILQRNPEVDAHDCSKETALHKVHGCMVVEDRAKITRELLKKAQIGAKCVKGQTALHKASEAGCTEVVEVLLDRTQGKGFINAPDDSTFTPLHLASKNGHSDTIELLLRHGADVEIKVKTTSKEQDRTALALAIGSLLQNKTLNAEKNSQAAISHIAKKSTEATKRNALYRAQMSLETENQLSSVLEAMKLSDDDGEAYPKQSDLEQTEFIWSSLEPERHLLLLQKLKAKASPLNEDEAGLGPEEDSVLQWAAYHGYYVVVYWLLRSSELKPRDDEANNREKAIKIAYHMLQRAKKNEEGGTVLPIGHSTEADGHTKQKRKVIQSIPAYDERTRDRSDSSSPNREAQRFHHTLDMLRDPPIGTDNDTISGDCKAPSLKDKPDKENISRDYEATIVDFYSRGSRVDLFRRQRPIYDVIYETDNGGPHGVMKMATSILKEVNPGDNLETGNEGKENNLTLRWIHLPANNLEWMEHVVQRVCHEDEQSENQHVALREFLRGSWREMPIGDSSVKFMNPCFVKGVRTSNRLSTSGGEDIENHHEHRTGKTGNDDNEKKREQEQELDQGSQGEKVALKEHHDVKETQQPHVSNLSPVRELEKYSLERQQTPAALYMPYLTFEKCYRRPCNCLQDIPDVGGFRAKCSNMTETINKPGMRGQVVHKIRSLDEFYYPNLPDLTSRNAAQVATRYLTDGIQGNRKEYGDWWPIIAVGQLWLWIIDEKTIISSSTAGYCGTEDPVVEGIFNQLREQMEHGGNSTLPSTVYQLSRLIVKYCINFTRTSTWNGVTRQLSGSDKYPEKLNSTQGKQLQLHGDKSPFEIFADSINRAAGSEISLFERFVNQVERNKNESRKHSRNKENTQPVSKVEQKQTSQLKGSIQTHRCPHDQFKIWDDTKQTNEHEEWEAIYDAAKLLGEVKDIQDELHMLKAVVVDQESVWNTLAGQKGNDRRRMEDKSIVERGPGDLFGELEEMSRLVDSIETSVKDTLNLEQNGINITEATVSRQLTEQSMRQGRSIMAFTVVTIFFLPMSFLTSMFALNVTSFQHDASGNLLYQPTFIFPVIFCVSIGLGVIIIIPALFYPDIGEFWKKHGNSQQKRPRTTASSIDFQKTSDPQETNQNFTNKTASQTVIPIDVPIKGTATHSRFSKSHLRDLRSSLHFRWRSKILDTEKGLVDKPDELSGNCQKG